MWCELFWKSGVSKPRLSKPLCVQHTLSTNTRLVGFCFKRVVGYLIAMTRSKTSTADTLTLTSVCCVYGGRGSLGAACDGSPCVLLIMYLLSRRVQQDTCDYSAFNRHQVTTGRAVHVVCRISLR